MGGSCSDGQKRDWEESKDGKGEDGEGQGPKESDKIGEEDAKWVINKVAQNVKNWNTQWGDKPGGLERWAQSILNPQVDWRTWLRNTISRSVEFVRGQFFTSYKAHSRRRHPNFILPGKVSPNPRITIIVDTSGSMSDDLLGNCLSEVQGVLKSVPVSHITVVAGDTHVGSKSTIRNINQVKLVGGGGTDMGALVEANVEGTDVIIVLTDGYTPWCQPVKPRVIACVFSDEPVPSWIDTIRIRPDT
jgi:predicted metal-dependent peptidase